MKLLDFLRTRTDVKELCVITQCGYTVATCWIDYEDLFMIPERLADKEVIEDSFGHLSVMSAANGVTMDVPCRYIEVEN